MSYYAILWLANKSIVVVVRPVAEAANKAESNKEKKFVKGGKKGKEKKLIFYICYGGCKEMQTGVCLHMVASLELHRQLED